MSALRKPQDPGVGPAPGMAEKLSGFAATLRDNGFAVGLRETGDALRLMSGPSATRPSQFRPALKALFCSRQSDWAIFDEIFDAWWMRRGMKSATRMSGAPQKSPSSLQALTAPGNRQGLGDNADHVERREGGDDESAGSQSKREGASRAENLGKTDFRHLTNPEDLAAAHALAERLARSMKARITRRMRARQRGERLDLRRTIHKSIASGGTPFTLIHRKRRPRPLRLVVLLDASGSMSLYSAVFLRFMHGVLDHFREAEAFLFHTRLIHISPALRENNPQRAVDRMALMGQGTGGGTKIGESLSTFNRWHARRVLNSRSCVMIVSDGYDTGPAERLGEEMRSLKKRCRRIVWLNPMIGWRDYAPEAAGMKAALPYVDFFAPAHNLESLEALEPYLARI